MKGLFGRLPEGCISDILSCTSASDASRLSVVSKAFKSAADSDKVWERFLPPDWRQILSRSAAAAAAAADCTTRKELYFSLCHTPILVDGGKMSICLEKRSGKKCYIVGARELLISWKSCWDFESHPNSRFSEVAKLRSIGWIHIQGNMRTRALSEDTSYAAYLVFWLDSNDGLRSSNTLLRFLNDQPKCNKSNGHLVSQGTGKIARKREDGWLEIEMGKFYNDGKYDEIEVWMIEINSPHGKAGLVVEGIEFRPV